MVLLAVRPSDSAAIFYQLLYIIILCLVIGIAGFLTHRYIKRRLSDPDPTPAFSLADLRRLHAQGKLSDKEYEHARSVVLAEGLSVLHNASLADPSAIETDKNNEESPPPLDNNPG